MATDERYLQKKGDSWWYARRTPKALYLIHPDYDKPMIWINAHTTKLVEAKSFRALQNVQINLDMAAFSKYGSGEGSKVRYLKDIYRKIQSSIANNYTESFDHEGNLFYEAESIDDGIDLDSLQTKDPDKFEAIVQILAEPTRGRFDLTLKETLTFYLTENSNLAHRTKDKHKVAVRQFLQIIEKQDIRIIDLNKRFVRSKFYVVAPTVLSANQVNTTLQCLSRVFSSSIVEEELEDAPKNPFFGFKKLQTHAVKYKHFTESQLHKLFLSFESVDFSCRKNIECYLALSIIWTTGARREEICSLLVSEISVSDQGVLYFDITHGKTKSAIRRLTVHYSLIDSFNNQIKYARSIDKAGLLFTTFKSDRVDNKNGEYLGRWFGAHKKKSLPNLGSMHSIHSFRRHTATALEVSGFPESMTVWILGHKRGIGESYGHYSAGPSLDQTLEAINSRKSMLSSNFDKNNHYQVEETIRV